MPRPSTVLRSPRVPSNESAVDNDRWTELAVHEPKQAVTARPRREVATPCSERGAALHVGLSLK